MQLIVKDFSRVSKNYNKVAIIQKKVAQNLAKISLELITENDLILDVGSGTGFIAKELIKSGINKKNITQSDISSKMCKVAEKYTSCIVADAQKLPFKDASFNFATSSLCLQWVNLQKALGEINRVLKPNSYFVFSIFLDGSLKHLKQGLPNKVNNFYKKEEIEKMLTFQNFKKVDIKIVTKTQKFKSIFELLHSIKNVGGSNKTKSRSNFLSKGQLMQLEKDFLKIHKKLFNQWKIGIFVYKKV
jgi:malonyl-CoA O-methyltransferase